MLFYRQGEFTDETEREKLRQVTETGDEYQKGLAFCCLAATFVICGIALFLLHGIYLAADNTQLADAFKIGGTTTHICFKCNTHYNFFLNLRQFV